MRSFRIRGLSADRFAPLFSMSNAELASRNARRMIARDAGYPCRVSLTDATPGDQVVLVNYEHHAVASPYRSSFAIFVRPDEQQFDAIDTVPDQLRKRTLSLRAYDRDGLMRTAELLEGTQFEEGIARIFADSSVAYVHAHFARFGCYAALIERH